MPDRREGCRERRRDCQARRRDDARRQLQRGHGRVRGVAVKAQRHGGGQHGPRLAPVGGVRAHRHGGRQGRGRAVARGLAAQEPRDRAAGADRADGRPALGGRGDREGHQQGVRLGVGHRPPRVGHGRHRRPALGAARRHRPLRDRHGPRGHRRGLRREGDAGGEALDRRGCQVPGGLRVLDPRLGGQGQGLQQPAPDVQRLLQVERRQGAGGRGGRQAVRARVHRPRAGAVAGQREDQGSAAGGGAARPDPHGHERQGPRGVQGGDARAGRRAGRPRAPDRARAHPGAQGPRHGGGLVRGRAPGRHRGVLQERRRVRAAGRGDHPRRRRGAVVGVGLHPARAARPPRQGPRRGPHRQVPVRLLADRRGAVRHRGRAVQGPRQRRGRRARAGGAREAVRAARVRHQPRARRAGRPRRDRGGGGRRRGRGGRGHARGGRGRHGARDGGALRDVLRHPVAVQPGRPGRGERGADAAGGSPA